MLLKKGYIEKEDSDYSVALTKKGRLKLEEILIKKEYLLSQDNICLLYTSDAADEAYDV